ncbi:hypothetical protein D3C87_2191050 [compost metagenome]
MIDAAGCYMVACQQLVEIAAAAGDAYLMTEPSLLACEIDCCMDMSVQPVGVVKKMHDTHV